PGRASGCTLCRGRAWTAAGVARPADNAASGPPRANETRSCGQSPASGRWPISKGLWRTTLEPATHPHLCTSCLLLLAEFGDGVLQRWGFFIPAILRNMFPAVLSILVPAMTHVYIEPFCTLSDKHLFLVRVPARFGDFASLRSEAIRLLRALSSRCVPQNG